MKVIVAQRKCLSYSTTSKINA